MALPKEATTPFQAAVHRYIEGLSPKKRKHSFIVALNPSSKCSFEVINEAMLQVEKKTNDKTLSKMRRVLRPVIHVLKDYYGVVDVLSNADPMPTAIIWGALKVVIDGSSRFIDLFDRMKTELLALTTQLHRLILYEDLYEDSAAMQEHLCNSYINLLRFWHTVNKECDRCSTFTNVC